MNDEFCCFTRRRSSHIRRHAGIVAGIALLHLSDEEGVLIGEDQPAIAIDFHRLIIFEPCHLERTKECYYRSHVYVYLVEGEKASPFPLSGDFLL